MDEPDVPPPYGLSDLPSLSSLRRDSSLTAPTDTDRTGCLLVKRRTYLKLLGSVGSSAAIAGCETRAGTENPTVSTPKKSTLTPEPALRLTVLNAVEDLGMDPTGHEPIDEVLDETYDDHTAIEFPPGEYLVTREHDWDRGVENFRLVGLGKSHKDVQFVFPRNDPGEQFRMFRITSGDRRTDPV